MPLIAEAAVRSLASFKGEDAPVTSCYLDVDGRRALVRVDFNVPLAKDAESPELD